MGVRNVWLLAIAVGITGHVFAQEPATAEAPIPATPAPSGTLIHTLGAFFQSLPNLYWCRSMTNRSRSETNVFSAES